MSRASLCCLSLLLTALGGCGSLSKTIEKRVEVAETCRAAMADPLPGSADPRFPVASIRLGDVGSCELGYNSGIVALCAFDQIWKKYQGEKIGAVVGRFAKSDGPKPEGAVDAATVVRPAALAQLDAVQKQWQAVSNDFIRLQTALRALDADRIEKIKDFDKLNVAQRAQSLRTGFQNTALKLASVSRQIDTLRLDLTTLRGTMAVASAVLEEQALIELAAWDANVRALLDKLEQVLGGQASVVIAETLKNQVIRHVAKRSLDLLHGSLKPADAVIDKLDQKAYGLVSVGYLAFQPYLQEALDSSYNDLKQVYARRNPLRDGPASEAAHARVFLIELRRAACENLVEGTRFTILSELVDTMLIAKIDQENNLAPVPDTQPSWHRGLHATDVLTFETSASYAAMADAAPALTPAPAPASPPEPVPALPPAAPTPGGVYLANEWAARQQLLVQAIAAQRKSGATATGDRTAVKFPDIATVDESQVRQLADAATARSIDDAARVDPALLALAPDTGTIASAISNQVVIVTAATAVSQASATLTANLNNNNVNTFNPTNTNAPIINLPPYPSPSPAVPGPPGTAIAPSLCAADRWRGAGASCMVDGDDYVIVLDSVSGYAGDTCGGRAVTASLVGVAAILQEYGARHGASFAASVAGYASARPAALARCASARQPRHIACTYWNRTREAVPVQGCTTPAGDKNLLLSAARAKHAAYTLEDATQGSLLVRSIHAMGAQPRDIVRARHDPAADQTVVMRFRQVR